MPATRSSVAANLRLPKTGTWSVGTWRANTGTMDASQTGDVASVWGTSVNDYWAGGDTLVLCSTTRTAAVDLDSLQKSFFPTGTGAQSSSYRMHGVLGERLLALSFTGSSDVHQPGGARNTGTWKL